MESMVTTGSVTQLWQGLVREAETRMRTRLEESLESYLVFTLVRHSRDAMLAGRTLALEYLDGIELSGELRQDRLRDVGDRCLLIAGLFPEQAQRRRVSRDYYLDLGSAAYRELGHDRQLVLAQLYGELAETFMLLVRVLLHVRQAQADGDAATAGLRSSLLVAVSRRLQ